MSKTWHRRQRKRKHDPPKYLTTRKSDMHEEPDCSTSESGYTCALAEKEGEEHQMVVVDPD